MEHRVIEVDGVQVLAIKWQDDEERPCIRLMAKVSFIFGESDSSYESESARNLAFDCRLEGLAKTFVDLAKSAAGE